MSSISDTNQSGDPAATEDVLQALVYGDVF